MHIRVEKLTRTYRVPVRGAGVGAAFHSLIRPEYSQIKAVDDISFVIERGEMVGFIGPNGAGKTTTLKMLSGLLYPTAGIARVDGYTPWERKYAYLRKISMMMGNRSQLDWNNTVKDSFLVYKDIYGIPDPEFKKHIDELAGMLDLGGLLQKRGRNLSLGERAKCELVLALLHKPEILYLDEPTIGMDVTMQLRIRQYIQKYNRRYGATVMLTSHYMADITTLCQRVLLIHHGRLLYDGALTSLSDRLAPIRLISVSLDEDALLEGDTLIRNGMKAEILSRDGNQYILRANKEDAVKVCSALMQRYTVRDLSVQTPPIETVIDQIYQEGVIA